MKKLHMIDELNNLFRLTKEHIKQACKVSGRAFQDDPVTKYMFPDEIERREKVLYGFVPIYKHGIRDGEVYATSENLEGIAVWIPPKKVHQSIWSMMRHGGFHAMRKTGFKAMKKGMPIYKYLDPAHKRLAPFDHWYLQSIAVEPEEQGKGYGSSLLRAMITKIDNEGLPIYLETNTEKNMLYYEKFGFEVVEHIIIPKTEIPIWCMLRKSQKI